MHGHRWATDQVELDVLEVLALAQVVIIRHRQEARAMPSDDGLQEPVLNVGIEHLPSPHGCELIAVGRQ